MKIFITGIAGMIGFHLARQLWSDGHDVMGIDDYNSFYYDWVLKMNRAKLLKEQGIHVITGDFCYGPDYTPDLVIHLAAHAAVRHSMDNAAEYFDNNVIKTDMLIRSLEKRGVQKVIYASTSCVQHGQPLPWKESDRPGHQNNPYGISKRVNECQFLNSNIENAVGLRFFTAYGPWGRPDMALHKFVDAMVRNEPITVYNNGIMKRDFTYVDDVVKAISYIVETLQYPNYWDMDIRGNKEIYNVGRGKQVDLMEFIRLISKKLQKYPSLDFQPAHPADVLETWADNGKLRNLGWEPTVDIEQGVSKFVDWYKEYYGC